MKKIIVILFAIVFLFSSAGFASPYKDEDSSKPSASGENAQAAAEKNGDIYILFTSDVHCGADKGFGYAGLAQIRDVLESQGYETILVDDGDSIQGEIIGSIDKGETMIGFMNALGYDVAIPGNHEFDYGTDRFLELTKLADFPYICCNFTYKDELVLEPYVIKEAAGKKIAFVGVTTPKTLVTSHPSYFQNEKGEFVYGFLQDKTGEKVYDAVQKAVDAATEEGADYIYVMGHLGYEAECSPWTYADVIEHTSGFDVFLDGHSHDTEQVVMKNKDGKEVTRSAVGTQLCNIGYSRISAEKGIVETGIWSWPNSVSAPDLLNIENEISEKVNEAREELDETMDVVIGTASAELYVNDPTEKDSSGNPIRMIRRAETNLGDFCADAFREAAGADVAFVNGGGIRRNIEKGKITYQTIINVYPYNNMLCMVEVTGQQILDALEWGARSIPEENGGFLQVSGLSYEVDPEIPDPCIEDENKMFVRIEGKRRVKNVAVGDEPLDSKKTYRLAGMDYLLIDCGDGFTMFKDAPLLLDRIKIDYEVLTDYLTDTLDGEIGGDYTDPYGQGRITITG